VAGLVDVSNVTEVVVTFTGRAGVYLDGDTRCPTHPCPPCTNCTALLPPQLTATTCPSSTSSHGGGGGGGKGMGKGKKGKGKGKGKKCNKGKRGKKGMSKHRGGKKVHTKMRAAARTDRSCRARVQRILERKRSLCALDRKFCGRFTLS
jgi:hypothetical protein